MKMRIKNSTSGIVLLELILALTIFSLVVVALARSLQSSVEAATVQQKEQVIQEQMRSFLDWVRLDPKDPDRMKALDLENGVKFTPSLIPLEVKNKDGASLTNLYTLQIQAQIPTTNTNLTRSIQITVYAP
ncbi:MAG: type II secretion system protein [Verrucomicrobiota bacterium]